MRIRRCFTKLRISCHKLEIEIGRYKKIPAESRFCPICKSDNIEDELHFLTEGPAFSVERNVFFNKISKMCKNFTSMSNFRKFIWLFSNENAIVLRVFAQFVYGCYVRDLNCYQESEYLELTISSWKVGFLA